MSSKIRFMFLRDNKFQPVGCIAIKLNRAKSMVEYQVSVLNPQDKFKRAVGRQLALGRLAELPISVRIKKDSTMHDVTKAVLNDIRETTELFPSRARKAARNWLNAFRLDFINPPNSIAKVDPFDLG